jgi:hypothetical protein
VPVTLGQSGTALSHTGNASEFTLASVSIPAGIMGANGHIEVETLWKRTNGAAPATINCRVRLGAGGTAYLASGISTAEVAARFNTVIANAGATNSQIGGLSGGLATSGAGGGYGQTTVTLPTGAIDTTAATTVNITGQLTQGSVFDDKIYLLDYRVTVYPHA